MPRTRAWLRLYRLYLQEVTDDSQTLFDLRTRRAGLPGGRPVRWLEPLAGESNESCSQICPRQSRLVSLGLRILPSLHRRKINGPIHAQCDQCPGVCLCGYLHLRDCVLHHGQAHALPSLERDCAGTQSGPSHIGRRDLTGDLHNHRRGRALMSLRITEGRPGRKRQRTGKPDFWFDALTAFTGENPVDPDCNFDESVDAWLEWG